MSPHAHADTEHDTQQSAAAEAEGRDEHVFCFCISDRAAYHPDCSGKSTSNALDDVLEHEPDISPMLDKLAAPQPYCGDDIEGFTRTVSPHEHAVSAQDTQHTDVEEEGEDGDDDVVVVVVDDDESEELHACCSCISDLAAVHPDCSGKSTSKLLDDVLEHEPDIVPLLEDVAAPQPYCGDDIEGFTRTVSPHEHVASAQDTQHVEGDAEGEGVGDDKGIRGNEHNCHFSISSLAAFQSDWLGKSTRKSPEERLEHDETIVPMSEARASPQP